MLYNYEMLSNEVMKSYEDMSCCYLIRIRRVRRKNLTRRHSWKLAKRHVTPVAERPLLDV